MRVITTVSEKYMALAALWLHHYAKSGTEADVHIYCFDTRSLDFVRALEPDGIALTAHDRSSYGQADMRSHIVKRFTIFEELLKDGIDFVHSDLDAFWLANPLHELAAASEPAIFSQAYGWPVAAVKAWGFTLCGGFFYLRPTPGVLCWIENAANRMQEIRSDQQALCEILLEQKVVFTNQGEEYKSTPVRLDDAEPFSIRVLGESRFVRGDTTSSKTCVFHPLLRPAKFVDEFVAACKEMLVAPGTSDLVEVIGALARSTKDTKMARLAVHKLVQRGLVDAAKDIIRDAVEGPEKQEFVSLELETISAEYLHTAQDPELTYLANFYGSDKGTVEPPKHFYTRFYQDLLDPVRTSARSVLELGLQKRGKTKHARKTAKPTHVPSISMWLDYFPQAEIWGFDYSDFSNFETDRFSFVQGDLSSNADLDHLVSRVGTLDVVIDDASHASWHQYCALAKLGPIMNSGGLYIIEDLHHQPSLETSLPAVPTFAAAISEFLDSGEFPLIDNLVDLRLGEVFGRVKDCNVLYGSARFDKALKAVCLEFH